MAFDEPRRPASPKKDIHDPSLYGRKYTGGLRGTIVNDHTLDRQLHDDARGPITRRDAKRRIALERRMQSKRSPGGSR